MRCLRHNSIVSFANAQGADRTFISQTPNGHVFVVADGAGGVAGGSHAATQCVSFVQNIVVANLLRDEVYWVEALTRLDEAMLRDRSAGESTCIVIEVRDGVCFGTCVGDSRAVHFDGDEAVDLTFQQSRKPLLGSGDAVLRPIRFDLKAGRLVLATDGLWKYALRNDILTVLDSGDWESLPGQLVDSVRLPSGNLQDDVGIIIVDVTP
ncbi:MAG: protein phosphatase 2C domain-containing protein [Phycisphaerales bacterium]|nr:protein phosphatase 2C domain-containing protein [Phycisphaerales bacterium]